MQICTLDHSSFWNDPMYEVDETEECDLHQKTVHRCSKKILIDISNSWYINWHIWKNKNTRLKYDDAIDDFDPLYLKNQTFSDHGFQGDFARH